MRPQKVTATGIKTGGISLELAPVTIVTGDNGSGKSAIADAIKLALLGSHPVLGSRNAEIMKLSNGDILEVEVDGARRTWTRKGKTVSLEENDEAKALADFPPVILDFESFTKAKATARREILEACLPVIDREATRKEIVNKVATIGFETGAEDFLALTTEAGDSGKEWKQEATRLKGAIQSLEIELAEEIVEPEAPESIDDLKAEHEKEIIAFTLADAAVKNLYESTTAAGVEPTEPRPSEEEVGKAQHNLDIQKDIVRRNETRREANLEREERIRKIKAAPEPKAVVELKTDLEGLKTCFLVKSNEARVFESKARDLQARADKVNACPACPTCGTAGEAFEEAITELILEPLNAAKNDAVFIHAEAVAVSDEISKVEKLIAEALAEKVSIDEAAIADIQENAEPYASADVDRAEYELNRLTSLSFQWEKFEALPKPPTVEEIKLSTDVLIAIEIRRDAAARKIRVLEFHSKKVADRARREGDLKKAKEDLEKASSEIKSMKALGDWSKEKSLEATAARLRPLLDSANSILDGVVDGELCIDGTAVGLHRSQGKHFRPIEVLSGAEAAATAAAIQVAIASTSTLSFVIVDELSRLTAERKESLITNLDKAIAENLIEGVLIIDHDAEYIASFDEVPGLLIHHVGE